MFLPLSWNLYPSYFATTTPERNMPELWQQILALEIHDLQMADALLLQNPTVKNTENTGKVQNLAF